MTKGEETKEKIIRQAAGLFWAKGYTATGVQDVLTAAGVTKGSFYFYFKSKKDVGFAAADFYETQVLGMMEGFAAREGTWESFIRSVVSVMIEEAEAGHFYGCPFSVLGMEIAFTDRIWPRPFCRDWKRYEPCFKRSCSGRASPKGRPNRRRAS